MTNSIKCSDIITHTHAHTYALAGIYNVITVAFCVYVQVTV